MYYFKHDTDLALAYHKLADPFQQNWRDVFAKYFKEQHRPKWYNNDIMHSILNTIILYEDKDTHNNIVNIVNMPTTLSDTQPKPLSALPQEPLRFSGFPKRKASKTSTRNGRKKG